MNAKRLLVLVDPNARDGEAGLATAQQTLASGGHVILAALLSGPTAAPLRHYSLTEDIPLARAADEYLTQIAERLGSGRVSKATLTGDDFAGEVLGLIEASDVTTVVMPVAMPRYYARSVRALITLTPVPLAIVPMSHEAA